MKKIFVNPVALLQLVAILIILVSAVSCMVGWIIVIDVTLPKLLLGLGIVLWVISKAEGGIVLTLSILLVGTVVAEDRLLLAAAALLSGEAEAALNIYEQRRSITADSLALTPAASSQTVLAGLPGVSEVSADQVSKIIDRARVVDTANQIIDYSAPLDSLYTGGREWREFASEYQEYEAFQEDMRGLRNAGVAVFEGENYASAQITQLGIQVYQYQQELLAVEDVPLEGGATTEKGALVLDGIRLQGDLLPNETHVYSLAILEAGAYVIETDLPLDSSVPSADTYIDLVDQSGNFVDSNDDKIQGDRMSRIYITLEPGNYSIRVTDFFGNLGAYLISARRDEVAVDTPLSP